MPGNISRGWDRHHDHSWNHHHYRWSNNDWVIFDGGYYTPYYDYSYPYDYSYDYGPDVSYSYSTSGGSLTADVQQALVAQGYNPGGVDGAMGPQTRDAIAAFQGDHGLSPTGQLNGATLGALGLR